MDLSQFFTDESSTVYDVVEPPLGAMYVMTYLQKRFGSGINGKIIKSRIDFDNYPDLKARLDEFKPEIIGIRTLTFYKNFFHKVVSMIRQWGIDVPVIAGGPYAASGYPTLLQDRNVDLAVLGEGELTFSELIEKIIDNNKKLPGKDVLKQIPGIAFIHDREVSRKGFPLQKREVMMLDMINTRAQPAANPGHTARCMDLASIIYTSGSTGKPKGVMIEHGNVVNVVEWFTRRYNVHRDTPVLLLSDYTFDASMNQIFAALLHGAPLYVPPGEMLSDIEALRRYVEANRIYLINFIPGLLKELLCHGPKIESIRHIISGGDRLDEEIKDRIIEKGYILHNQYGPTEITIDALVSRCTPGKVVLGKPIANVKCYLLNKNNTIVPIGVPGEIYVAGHGVTRGYLNNPELTAQKYRSYGSYRSYKTYKSYQTGDLGRWLPDGNIEFLGRIDHQVKIRGYRIELGEIENRILKKQGIDQAVVLDKKDQKGGAYLCAYIRANKTFESSELAEFLAKDLPAYMIPAYFIPVEKIPLAANGKIDRKALPEPGIKVKPGHISPANKTEKTLAGIWSEVLGVDKAVIGIDSNFFQLGGQSLSATILISKVHRVFDVKLTLMEIFKSPSIKELADHIKTAKEERYLAVEPAEAREYYVLSAPQKRLYILQQIEKNTVHYNVTTALELEGAADMERLTGTFKKLIQRHESFRTSFVLLDEVPYQHIHEPDEVEFEIEYKEVEVEVEEEEEPFGQINAFGEEAKGHHSSFIIHHSFIIRPFDLSQAPLLRVGLIRLAANRHILVLDINHIIVDGASVGIFVKDFMALYKGDELPPLKTRYRDYAQWQNSKRQRHRIKSQEDYWLRQFATEIPALNLTLDYPRPAIQCFEGSELFFQVEAERTKALKALALEEEASLYMVLLAIFTILLSKLSRQEDIVVGTPTAGRRHAALDNIIGMLVNTLPMRNFPAKTYTFKEFLNEVKQNALDAFENQDYPFEELVDKAVPTRDSSRNPIFDILFVFQNMEIPEAEIPGMKLKPYQIEHNISPFDLYLNAEEAGDKLHFTFCFCTRLFKEKKIRRFIGYFQDIISHVIENIDIRLADIKISHELKEKKLNIPQQVREGFNF
jgi:amino acid adenylation domain-containing protein